MRFLSAAFIGCAAISSIVGLSQGCSGATPTSGFGDKDGAANPGDDGSTTGFDGQVDEAGSFGDGALVDSGVSADASCATATAKAARQGVYMLIVLDGSGSMGQDRNGNPVQKWNAVVPALDTFFDDLKTKNDPSFAVGLTVFSDAKDTSCNILGTCNYNTIQVPIRAVDAAQAAALRARIDPSSPSNGTPTFSVLSGQFPALEAYTAALPVLPGGKKVLVLMTDGVPNGGTSEQTSCENATKAEFTKAAPQGPITTFAVGIGNYNPLVVAEYDPAFMGRLAVAGGAPNPGCDATNVTDPLKMCHFQITPGSKTAQQLEADFLAAINAIRGQVASCEFVLEKLDGGNIDPTKVNVEYDDGNGNKVVIPPDPVNGWTYDDPTTPTKVILHGTSCATMKANAKGSINVILGCKTIQPH